MYLNIYVAIIISFLLEAYISNVFFTFLIIIFIAGRQHSLYILNHDAVHYGLFKSKKHNKAIATIFSNFVMFHHPEAWSFIQWKKIHIFHHAFTLTNQDPNYVSRKNSGDTIKVYGVRSLLFECIKTGPTSIIQFFLGKQDYVSPRSNKVHKRKINHLSALFFPFKKDKETENERIQKILFIIISLAIITYTNFWYQFIVLWIIPMYTIYPMILRFFDLSEHHWSSNSEDLNKNTRSIHPGLFSKILFSFLPRGLHREHHVYANIIAIDLPKLSNLLQQEKIIDEPINGYRNFFQTIKKT